MGYYTEKAKEVKAKQDAEMEQLKSALQTLGVATEEKEENKERKDCEKLKKTGGSPTGEPPVGI